MVCYLLPASTTSHCLACLFWLPVTNIETPPCDWVVEPLHFLSSVPCPSASLQLHVVQLNRHSSSSQRCDQKFDPVQLDYLTLPSPTCQPVQPSVLRAPHPACSLPEPSFHSLSLPESRRDTQSPSPASPFTVSNILEHAPMFPKDGCPHMTVLLLSGHTSFFVVLHHRPATVPRQHFSYRLQGGHPNGCLACCHAQMKRPVGPNQALPVPNPLLVRHADPPSAHQLAPLPVIVGCTHH